MSHLPHWVNGSLVIVIILEPDRDEAAAEAGTLVWVTWQRRHCQLAPGSARRQIIYTSAAPGVETASPKSTAFPVPAAIAPNPIPEDPTPVMTIRTGPLRAGR